MGDQHGPESVIRKVQNIHLIHISCTKLFYILHAIVFEKRQCVSILERKALLSHLNVWVMCDLYNDGMLEV